MRSAQAAKDTAALIEDSLSKSKAGNAKLEQVILVFQGISESAAKVKILGRPKKLEPCPKCGLPIGYMERRKHAPKVPRTVGPDAPA